VGVVRRRFSLRGTDVLASDAGGFGYRTLMVGKWPPDKLHYNVGSIGIFGFGPMVVGNFWKPEARTRGEPERLRKKVKAMGDRWSSVLTLPARPSDRILYADARSPITGTVELSQ